MIKKLSNELNIIKKLNLRKENNSQQEDNEDNKNIEKLREEIVSLKNEIKSEKDQKNMGDKELSILKEQIKLISQMNNIQKISKLLLIKKKK